MFTIPYIPFYNLAVDNIIIAILSFMVASMVNAEAKNYVAMSFGSDVKKNKRAFSFNPLSHSDIFSFFLFFFFGFGFARGSKINYDKMKKKQIFIIHLAGPIANLLFANIVSSILYMAVKFSPALADEKVLNILLITNLTFCVYNLLLPLPPFSLGKALTLPFFLKFKISKKKRYFLAILLFMILFSLDFFVFKKSFSNALNQVVVKIHQFIL